MVRAARAALASARREVLRRKTRGAAVAEEA
jgi:hypothetical protein